MMKTHMQWIVDSYVKTHNAKKLHQLKIHRQNFLESASKGDQSKIAMLRRDYEDDVAVIDAGLLKISQGWALQGHVDAFSETRIAGWACYKEHLDVPVTLTVHFDGMKIAHVVADRHRIDLQELGFGDGRHGFEFTPPLDAYLACRIIEIRAPNHVSVGILKK